MNIQYRVAMSSGVCPTGWNVLPWVFPDYPSALQMAVDIQNILYNAGITGYLIEVGDVGVYGFVPADEP